MQECRHISITDITHEDVTDREDCKRVIIKFFPELPSDWKKNYDKNREKCQYIVNNIDNETTQV